MVRGQIANSYRPHSRLELHSTWKALDIAEVADNDVCGDWPTTINCSFIARVVMLQVDHQRNSSHFWDSMESLNA
jgi:hypothetical protein